MKIIILLAFIVGTYHSASAQSSSPLIGARSNGIGYASACLDDAWSIFNNAGGLAKTTAITVACTYDAVPNFKPFNRAAALVAIPTTIGVGGLGVYRFGDDLYNEEMLTAAFSNSFGLASLGFRVNYLQYNLQGFGRKDAVTVSFGGIATLTPKISFGAHITNINQPLISHDGTDEKLPSVLHAGLSFKSTNKLLIVTEIQKDLDYKPCWKAGIEYEVHRKIFFRTGVNLQPNAGFAGLGFNLKYLKLDYAYTSQMNLGARHQASISYVLHKEKK